MKSSSSSAWAAIRTLTASTTLHTVPKATYYSITSPTTGFELPPSSWPLHALHHYNNPSSKTQYNRSGAISRMCKQAFENTVPAGPQLLLLPLPLRTNNCKVRTFARKTSKQPPIYLLCMLHWSSTDYHYFFENGSCFL